MGPYQLAFPAFVIGSLLMALTYWSIEPIVLGIAFWGVGAFIISSIFSSRSHEYLIFSIVFSIVWCASGFAAFCTHVVSEGVYFDGVKFYWFSTRDRWNTDLESLRGMIEGSLAAWTWRRIYDFLGSLGFAKNEYIGVLVNNVLVAISGVMAVRIARRVYGDDDVRLNRLVLLFSGCGLLWLFAALHLRDAFLLFAVTLLILVWTSYLHKQTFRNLVTVIVASIVFFQFMGYLRTEFVFVPVTLIILGLFSLFTAKEASVWLRIAVGVAAVVLLFSTMFLRDLATDATQVLTEQGDHYSRISGSVASSDSLGMSMVVNQPTPIRVPLRIVLLFVYPIPVWWGFQLEEPYDLFKSLNAIFNYLFVPLLSLGIIHVITKKQFRTPSLVFFLLITISYILAIASTSGENRHLGAFMVPLLLLALLPDLTQRSIWQTYKDYLGYYVGAIVSAHIAWLILKSF